jgi:hypothetical protein
VLTAVAAVQLGTEQILPVAEMAVELVIMQNTLSAVEQ